jgi:hypothetical protein
MSGYVTLKGLAEDLGMSTDAVRKMIRDLNVPMARITSQTALVKLADLDHALRRIMVRGSAPADPMVDKLSRDLDAFLGAV